MKSLQNEKGVIPVIVVVILAIIVVGVGYGVYQSFGPKPTSLPSMPSAEPSGEPSASEEPTTEPQQALEINFTETGNILNWDSQTESYTEDWTLLYEKPGNPAISVKLVFDENSLCDGEVCDTSKLNNGDRAKVEGNRSGDEVTVINLAKL
jgi:hypothetical protein